METNNTMNHGFTPMKVSTTTITCMINRKVNIIDIAKSHPLDNEILGIKLNYASGNQTIIKGNSKPPKKKRDFYNQITFSMRLPTNPSILVSCKIFHNGRIHVTGAQNVVDAKCAAFALIRKVEALRGIRKISVKTWEQPLNRLLIGYDQLIYSSDGSVLGWIHRKDDTQPWTICFKGDIVEPNTIKDTKDNEYAILQSVKWTEDTRTKKLYTLDGDVIGYKRLDLEFKISKRHFDVKFGYVYANNQIVGKEVVEYVDNWEQTLKDVKGFHQKIHESGYLIHPYYGFLDEELPIEFDKIPFDVHMINLGFSVPFMISKERLHQCFLEHDFDSRFDSCSSLGCNLRFYLHEDSLNTPEIGKCPCESLRSCICKKISVIFFNTGKVNIAGLKDTKHGEIVYRFVADFFTKHRTRVEFLPPKERNETN